MLNIFNRRSDPEDAVRPKRVRSGAPRVSEVFGQPSLARPISQMCTESQFYEPAYSYWCEQIREHPRTHRKQWEFCFILQALSTRGKLSPQFRGLGFGVGEEPLTALFAARGVEVTATDLGAEQAAGSGWIETSQHAKVLDDLNGRSICPAEPFASRVNFQAVDMNAVPASFQGYDFTWSACALEHLGSLKAGQDFILASLDTLGPGGVAVHTTEFNLDNTNATLDLDSTVLFRRQDLEVVFTEAIRRGFRCSVNWSPGEGRLDTYVDMPPYSPDEHLKLQIEAYVTTSIGLIFERDPASGSAARTH